jgi:hypothetical protein
MLATLSTGADSAGRKPGSLAIVPVVGAEP